MRSRSAIFLLIVFAFSQYAKELSYLQCKLANSFSPVRCDCEKVLVSSRPVNTETPAAKTHFHIQSDEFYTSYENEEHNIPVNISPAKLARYVAQEAKGDIDPPFRPPGT